MQQDRTPLRSALLSSDRSPQGAPTPTNTPTNTPPPPPSDEKKKEERIHRGETKQEHKMKWCAEDPHPKRRGVRQQRAPLRRHLALLLLLGTPLLLLSLLSTVVVTGSVIDEDTHEHCSFWAAGGECETNADYMLEFCATACNHAVPKTATPADYGASIGVDGLPFNMEVVLQRSVETDTATTCSSTDNNTTTITTTTNSKSKSKSTATTNKKKRTTKTTTTTPAATASLSSAHFPKIVRLPATYPANVTLAPPLAAGMRAPTTLDELHRQGRLTYAEYVKEKKPTSQKSAGVAVKVINFTRRRFRKMWDDGADGVYNGDVPGGLGQRTVINTYAGHTFAFIDLETGELYRRITMKNDVHYIVLEPAPDDYAVLRSEKYAAAMREKRFMEEYYQHYGYPWLATYGRPEPVLNMWPANYLGQTHTVQTQHGYWTCDEPDHPQKCHNKTPADSLSLELTVASHAGVAGPRVFVIPNLMSDAECDHILRLGKQVVQGSMVGNQGQGFQSKSRTSSTGWLDRSRSAILQTMQKRFADVLGLDEARMTQQDLAEALQVVRYEHGQQYNPHHDFGDEGTGRYGQRFLTLLLYIEIPQEGGHTSFPKAFGGRGMRVKPPQRGGAVLFYSMLPDGNGDDLSLHGGDFVAGHEEKWVCNLWIWDPDRKI